MLRTKLRCPLEPASALVLLSMDWLLFLVNAIVELDLLSRAVLWSALFSGVVVWLIENVYSPGAPHTAAVKGAVVGLIIAVPGLWLGTALGLAMFACSAGERVARRLARRSERPPEKPPATSDRSRA